MREKGEEGKDSEGIGDKWSGKVGSEEGRGRIRIVREGKVNDGERWERKEGIGEGMGDKWKGRVRSEDWGRGRREKRGRLDDGIV